MNKNVVMKFTLNNYKLIDVYPPKTLENGKAKKNNAKAMMARMVIPEVNFSEDFTFLLTMVIKIAATNMENGCSTKVFLR